MCKSPVQEVQGGGASARRQGPVLERARQGAGRGAVR